jgi:hypothetical protein
MSGPVFTPSSAAKKALGFANQTTPGTPVTITTADLLDCAEPLSWTPQEIRASDPRYTGTTRKAGDAILGVTYDLSFTWPIHGPGNTVPAANAFIAGRVLQQLGFTEQRVTTAITEGFTAGTTNQITLGATASASADAHKGMVVNVGTVGAAPLGFAMIRAYTAGKVATLARLRATTATGTYSIPMQLTYTYSNNDPVAGASITIWEDGHRLNFSDMIPNGDQTITISTVNRDNQSFSVLQCTFSGVLTSKVQEAAPVVPITMALPPTRDGQDDFANIQMGGSSATLTINITAGYPPNANQATGSDPGVPVSNTRSMTIERNKVSLAVVNFDTLSQAQGYHAYQVLWGLAPGNYVGLMIANGRLGYRGPGGGNDFDTDTGSMLIDASDREISLAFPVGY